MSWLCPDNSSSVGTAKSGVPMKISRSGMSAAHAEASRPHGEERRRRVSNHGGRPILRDAVLRTASRRMGRRRIVMHQLLRPREFALLERLGEFLDDAIALELGNVVDKQHAVEMIDLMLDAGGEQTMRLDLVDVAVEIEIADFDLR